MSSQQATPRTISREPTLDELDFVRRASSRLVENYAQTGNAEHLDEAISMTEQTLAVRGRGSVHPLVLGDLGAMLYKRFERTGSLDDLNLAIDVVGQAIDATSEGDADHAIYLSNLGAWLRTRYERTASSRAMNRSGEGSGEAADSDKNDMPSVAAAPEGETIYANTPQHHGTVGLLQMSVKPGSDIESLREATHLEGSTLPLGAGVPWS